MTTLLATINRGERFELPVEFTAGSALEASSIRAAMKRVVAGRHLRMPDETTPRDAEFLVYFLTPATDFAGGVLFVLTEATTTDLLEGLYLMDSAVTIDGRTQIEGPFLVEVINSASGVTL